MNTNEKKKKNYTKKERNKETKKGLFTCVGSTFRIFRAISCAGVGRIDSLLEIFFLFSKIFDQ